jgi:hypothetical protein
MSPLVLLTHLEQMTQKMYGLVETSDAQRLFPIMLRGELQGVVDLRAGPREVKKGSRIRLNESTANSEITRLRDTRSALNRQFGGTLS